VCSSDLCEWLVPGMLEDKITALLKSLPQGIRRAFVPVPEYARAAVAALLPSPSGGRAGDEGARPALPLTDALAAFLTKTTGQTIPRDAWRPEALPPHLHMNFRLVDEAGKVLDESRDLAELRAKHGLAARQEMARSTQSYERDNVSKWDFGDLPETVEITSGKRLVAAYPALEPAPGAPRLTLFDHVAAAHAAHRLGVAQLLWLQFPDLYKQTQRDLSARLKAPCLHYALLFKGQVCDLLIRDALIAAARATLTGIPRNEGEFTAACAQARPRLPEKTAWIAQIANDTLAAAQRLTQALDRAPAQIKNAVADLRQQLAGLVFPGYLAAHAPERLQHLPRYLKAMELRLDKLPDQVARDQGLMNEMAPLVAAWRNRSEKLNAQGLEDAAVEDFRWRLEELRVGLFAQTLKTPEPVSSKRLEKRWQEIAK
jgi:ATP-dependent helicase HrpA